MARPGQYRLATEDRWLRGQANQAPQKDYLAFLVGDEEYGVEIERIREIIKVRALTEVPHVPPFIIGVIAVRGVVLPVIDLHARLRLSHDGMTRAARFLIVRRDEELFGLLVDEVRQVVRLAENEIEPPLSFLASGEGDYVAGIGRAHGRMVILLNLDNVLRFDVRPQRGQRGVLSSALPAPSPGAIAASGGLPGPAATPRGGSSGRPR